MTSLTKLMTDAEIDAKVMELQRNAAEYIQHAGELERFLRMRRARAEASANDLGDDGDASTVQKSEN